MFAKAAVLIWLVLILYRSYDYYSFNKNPPRDIQDKRSEVNKSAQTTDNVQLPDFNPEWQGNKNTRNKTKRLKSGFDGWMSTKDKAAKENNS